MPTQQLIIPPITPLRADESLDLEAFAQHSAFLVERGAHALFVAGTTGESALLGEAERKELARVAVEAVGPRGRVIVHVGGTSSAETRRLALHARAVGAHAVAAVTPYYFAYTQEQLIQHYLELLEALEGFPLYAYTIPQRAGNDLTPASLARLAGLGIAGIKDSSGDLNKIMAYLRAAPGLEVYAGADVLALALSRVGGHGIVSGPSMVMPELFRAMLDADAGGDFQRANALHRLAWAVSDAVGAGARIDWMRAGMEWRGLRAGPSRKPLPTIAPEERPVLEQNLEQLAAQVEALGVRLKPAA